MKIEGIQVEYIDHMGSDKTVVNSARVSFSKDEKDFELNDKDAGLINYLAKHDHWSPFAHNSIQFKIKAPIFVARQLIKHQVGGVWNEVSRRYIYSEPSFFTPDSWRGKPINMKQGSSSDLENQVVLFDLLTEHHIECLRKYNLFLEMGVCPEQARMLLPLSSNTDWYWTGSLMFWARVCKQRLDSHAQVETQNFAKEISKHCERLFPLSWIALIGKTNE